MTCTAEGFEIAEMSLADLPEITDLYAQYRVEIPKFNRLRTSIDSLPSFKAVMEGRTIGFAYCYSFAPDILELANIFVSDDHRNHGVGQALLESIVREARGSVEALIAVNSTSYEVREAKRRPDSFYARNGFTIAFETASSTLYVKQLH